MSTEQNFTSIRTKTTMILGLCLKSIPIFTLFFSTFAFAQVDSIQIRYAGDANGGWSGNGSDIPGPQDGACANMGAVGKENQAFAFGFTLPNDATIEAMSAEIFATTNDAPNQPIGVQLATGANTDPATGVIGTQQQVIVPKTGADCASATPQSFPSDGMGGVEADWGLPVDGWPTVAQVNAAAFGLVFTKLQQSSIKVDSVCLEIFYTTPAGPAVQEDCFADGAVLTLLKTVVQDNGGNNPDTDWTLTATGPTPGVTGVEGDAAITAAVVDAGDYTLTESSVPGYNQTNLSCNGGTLNGNVLTLADGNVAECTFTNDDVAPTVTLNKNVTNDNGGNAGVNDFGLTVGGAGVNSGDITPVDANTPIALNEAGLSGYDFVSITGDAGCPASLGGTVTLNEGESITCTINNDDVAPTITLNKNVINDNGGSAGVNDFGLTVGGAGVNSGDITPVDANTPVALDEAGLAGYSFVSITGDAGCPASLGGTVTLDEGESITCTINNDDDASGLTITKTITSDNGGTATLDDFDVTVDGIEVLWDDAGSTTGGSKMVTDQSGDYLLAEGTVEGYTNGVWSCGGAPLTNGGAFDGATVTVGQGENVTCMITNQDDDTALIVSKVIVSDNGGTADLDDFNVRVDDVEVSWSNPDATDSGMETVTTSAGTYTLAEDDFAGYSEGTWSCSDSEGPVAVTAGGAFDGSDVTVELGQTVTCSITNTDDPVSLTITKQVTNDNGGTAATTDFTLSADGPDANDISGPGGAMSTALDAGTYALSETTQTGYTPGNWFCNINGGGDVDSGVFDSGSVDLALGDVAVCTIINDDIQPLLTVTKIVINDDGGNAQVDDFDLFVDNDQVASGDQNGFNAGSYTVSETQNKDYSASIGGDCAANGAVTLNVGDVKECTIVNDDIAPAVPVPANNPLALLMAILGMLGMAWYFRPERIRSV